MELRGRWEESDAMNPVIASALLAGFAFGCLTIAALYLLKAGTWHGWVLTPDKNLSWRGPAVLIASAVVVVVIYTVGVRSEVPTVVNWMVVGYAAALGLVAAGLVGHELFLMLRDRIPQDLGLKVTAAAPRTRNVRAMATVIQRARV
jgi:hypothetical protein